MAAESPLRAIDRLLERLEKDTESIGLKMMGNAVTTGRGEGPDVLQVMFQIDKDVIGKSAEEREFDAQFKAIAAAEKAADDEERAKSTRVDATKLLEDLKNPGDGIFGDE